MLSERLRRGTLYEPRTAIDIATRNAVERFMRKLVIVMRLLEVRDGVSRSDIEDMVMESLVKAEVLYYGLNERDFMEIIGKEKANDERREKHIKRI